MLERIEAKNFQKHKKLDIKITEPIVSIIGPTDAGKSSIIRLLNWICFNKPRSNEFKQWGTKKVAGRITVDGHRILRSRNGDNFYKLDDKKFNVPKTDVPEEIKNLLNMAPENIQIQHETSFWLALTPGQISKELNNIADLSIADDVLSFVAKDLRSTKTKINVIEERLQDAKQEAEELSYAPEMHEDVLRLEKTFNQLDRVENEQSQLQSLIENLKTQNDKLKKLKSVLPDLQNDFDELESVHVSLMEVKRQLNKLNPVLKSAVNNEKRQDRLKSELEKKEIEFHKNMKGKCPICGQVISDEKTKKEQKKSNSGPL